MTDHQIRSSLRAWLCASASAACVLGAAGQAAAQAAEAAMIDEVVVTASRVSRDGYAAPTPTSVVSGEALESRGATNVATVLNELPAFRASTTPATNSVRSIFPGAYYADLRGLGSSRTLVLVDGNRYVPQITTGLGAYQVNLNQVPSLMLDRAEVVTGGASAQWGSDAVAGVVNLILKKKFEGLNVEAQYGTSEQGDNEEYRIGLLGGTQVGENGHLVAGVDYVDNKGVGDVWTRDWGRTGDYILANPCPLTVAVSAACPTGGNGQARQLILPDVRFSTATAGGIIVNSTGPAARLRGIIFGPGGTITQGTFGAYSGAQYMQGGSFNADLNLTNGVFIAPASERAIGYARFGYDVTEDVQVYAEGSYSYSVGRSQSLPPRNDQTSVITVTTDNPFIPAALRSQIDAFNLTVPAAQRITSFSVGRYSQDLGNAESKVSNETTRFVAGFDGDLGGWHWDGAFLFGRNDYDQRVKNNRIRSRFNFAADVVLNSAGQPVCRATLQGNAAAVGCIPMNIFGDGSAAAAHDFVTGTLITSTRYEQSGANLNVSGEPASTWAGKVSVAAGAEWRREKQVTRVDPFAEAAEYETTNARSLIGDFSVKEAYLETVVPLAADAPLARALDANAAIRVADYSTAAGTQTTWKVGLTWKPVEDVLIRAARSRDIRAPNIFELYTPPVSTITNQSFTRAPFAGGPIGQVNTQQLIGGNPDLQPEKGDTWTIGVVVTPSQVPGLTASLDYYDITVKDAITALGNATVVNGCNAGDAYFCGFIKTPAAGIPAVYLLDTPYVNLSKLHRSGLDLSVTYRRALADIVADAPGSVTLQFSGSYAMHYREDAAGAGYVERAGEISGTGTPRFQSTTSVTYALDPFQATLQMRTISSSFYNKLFVEGVDINDNRVEGQKYFSLSAQYDLSEKLQAFGVIDNLTDQDPTIAPVNFSFPTSPVFFDMIGRSYRVGLRYKM